MITINGREQRQKAIRQVVTLITIFTINSFAGFAQDTLTSRITLPEAVAFAIKNQPLIQQSVLDEEITASQIRSRLTDWLPQVNFGFTLQHNFLLPTSFIAGNAITAGVNNTSATQLGASQIIFNRDVLFARRTRGDLLLQTRQQTANDKIDISVNVTKAFYDVLTTDQQIKVAAENIVRLERSLKDATAQYRAGVADKIDYKRATITLNNLRALKRSSEEAAKAKLAYLRSLMAYPDSGRFEIAYDSASLENEIYLDTVSGPDYTARIEYRLLQTQQNLLKTNLLYFQRSYLPSVSANGGYNFNFQNNSFTKLYGNNYPNSFAAVTLAVPIFRGGKRRADIRTAQLQLDRNNLDIVSLKNNVNAQYAQALAGYKSSYFNYLALKENVLLAKEVYDVLQLQYRAGIKTYLEVITAETDLRTAQINYFNALYGVLSNKADVQKAAGQIVY